MFDTDLLRFSCAWAGKFLEFNTMRFGLGDVPVVAGFERFQTPVAPAGREWAVSTIRDNRIRWARCRARGATTAGSIDMATV